VLSQFVLDYYPALRETIPSLRHLVFYLGVFASLCCLLIIVQILLMRAVIKRRKRQKAEFRKIWRPVFLQAVDDKLNIAEIPELDFRHRKIFLSEWNRLMETIDGNPRENLRKIAFQMHIDLYIKAHLKIRLSTTRILCIVAAGHLKQIDCWDTLEQLLSEKDSSTSMLAGRALIQLDPKKAIDKVLKIATSRADWTQIWLDKLLLEVGPKVATKPVADVTRIALAEENSERLLSIVPLFNSIEKASAAFLLNEILQAPLGDKIVSRCLQTLQDREFADLARRFIHYPRWHVRVHAASALGRLGDERDIYSLISLLKDKQWWVRFRAAEALSQLKGMTPKEFRKIRENVDDHYARDILDYIIMERAIA